MLKVLSLISTSKAYHFYSLTIWHRAKCCAKIIKQVRKDITSILKTFFLAKAGHTLGLII